MSSSSVPSHSRFPQLRPWCPLLVRALAPRIEPTERVGDRVHLATLRQITLVALSGSGSEAPSRGICHQGTVALPLVKTRRNVWRHPPQRNVIEARSPVASGGMVVYCQVPSGSTRTQ